MAAPVPAVPGNLMSNGTTIHPVQAAQARALHGPLSARLNAWGGAVPLMAARWRYRDPPTITKMTA
jgi:hypothetical protein